MYWSVFLYRSFQGRCIYVIDTDLQSFVCVSQQTLCLYCTYGNGLLQLKYWNTLNHLTPNMDWLYSINRLNIWRHGILLRIWKPHEQLRYISLIIFTVRNQLVLSTNLYGIEGTKYLSLYRVKYSYETGNTRLHLWNILFGNYVYL